MQSSLTTTEKSIFFHVTRPFLSNILHMQPRVALILRSRRFYLPFPTSAAYLCSAIDSTSLRKFFFLVSFFHVWSWWFWSVTFMNSHSSSCFMNFYFLIPCQYTIFFAFNYFKCFLFKLLLLPKVHPLRNHSMVYNFFFFFINISLVSLHFNFHHFN